MKKTVRKIAGILGTVLLLALVAAVCFTVYCNATGKVAYMGGYATVRIVTPSMEPTIPTGSYVLVKKAAAENVQTGDVILFYSRDPSIMGKMNTHRVTDVRQEDGRYVFSTKGDNNTLADFYPVYEEDLSGVYVKNMTTLTTLAGAFKNPILFFVLIILPALVLLFFAGRDVKKGFDDIRHQKLVEEEIRKLERAHQKENGEELPHVQKDNPQGEDQPL